ncbi:hypothetical protein ACIQVT_02965 [Streptomyces sp. NPDC100445]|uniref:hypothetical protein n=1 Tax=Streptomyces sp. NPDC100445 TaxID=3366102 RepID=UPI0037F2504E
MRRWTKRAVVTAGTVIASSLSLAFPGPASAADGAAAPAPSCVAMYESWRYTQAANDCSDALDVMVVYQDGASGLCYALPEGGFTTVGEGYLGAHGHADHLAACEPS